jgi:phospholipid/cholesterol/gamma-HCH transport system substrate-binding protein
LERQAHYAFVGLLTLALAIGAFVFAFWLIQGNFNETYAEYDVVFDTPVNGLTEGGEVHFNGIKVGEVKELKLGQVNTSQVIASVQVEATTPVRVDSTAVLEPAGVTGLNYIQISPGTKDAAMLKRVGIGGPNPIIHATESTLDKLLAGSGGVIENAYESLNRINRLMSDSNLNTISQSLKNIEKVTADIGVVTDNLKGRQQLLDDSQKAIVQAGLAAESVAKLANSADTLMNSQAPQTLAKIEAATDELAKASSEVALMAKSIQDPVNELSDNTLPQMTESLRKLDQATASVEQLVDEARASPQDLLAKPKARDRKVTP